MRIINKYYVMTEIEIKELKIVNYKSKFRYFMIKIKKFLFKIILKGYASARVLFSGSNTFSKITRPSS